MKLDLVNIDNMFSQLSHWSSVVRTEEKLYRLDLQYNNCFLLQPDWILTPQNFFQRKAMQTALFAHLLGSTVGRSYEEILKPSLLVAKESTFTLINYNIPATSTLQKQRMKKRVTINTSPMTVPTIIPAMT